MRLNVPIAIPTVGELARYRRKIVSELIEEVRSSTPPHRRLTLKRRVELLRKSLKPDEQTLLTLRIDRKLSWAEVSEVLSLSEPALRKRFERIKEKLKRLAAQSSSAKRRGA